MEISAAISQLVERKDLTQEQMTAVMKHIMSGEATPAQIGGFLVALRMKGETVEEITAAAKVMRELVTPVPISHPHLVDTCGTGGDGAKVFNVSTASAFVVAAAGGKVAKHGNRSVTSQSGSADVLETAGAGLDLSPKQVCECIETYGVGFLFAPHHHPAMKHVIKPRKEMGVRTLFNILGPLTNPAGAPNQLIGVFDQKWLKPLAEVLQKLGSKHVLMVHAEDGLDEVSIAAPTQVIELKDGKMNSYTITPEQFKMQRQPLAEITVDSPEQSLETIKKALANEQCAARDIVALNAGAAIYAANLTNTIEQGVEMAEDILAAGTANEVFKEYIRLSAAMTVLNMENASV